MGTTGALVTKHVSRVRVDRDRVDSRLHWRDGRLVDEVSLGSSPSVAREKSPMRSVLKRTKRDPGLCDESMMEMSLLETKVVKKMAFPKGRGMGAMGGK